MAKRDQADVGAAPETAEHEEGYDDLINHVTGQRSQQYEIYSGHGKEQTANAADG